MNAQKELEGTEIGRLILMHESVPGHTFRVGFLSAWRIIADQEEASLTKHPKNVPEGQLIVSGEVQKRRIPMNYR
jgi:hypothetical protein